MDTFLGIAFWSGFVGYVLRGSVSGQGFGGYVFRDSVLVRFREVRFERVCLGSRFWRIRFSGSRSGQVLWGTFWGDTFRVKG